MTNEHKLALLAAMFSLQEEAGDAFDIAPDRIIALAAGEPASAAEQAVLLASPLAREELVLQRRLRALRLAEFWQHRVANDNAATRLRSRLEAAESEPIQDLDLHCAAGVLLLRRGPNARAPFLLTLTLDPGWWGGLQARIRVVVRESGPDGLVWMQGVTDGDGVLREVWPHPLSLGTPAARLAALRGTGGELARGLIIAPA